VIIVLHLVLYYFAHPHTLAHINIYIIQYMHLTFLNITFYFNILEPYDDLHKRCIPHSVYA
jgi:hypothetical protein